MEKLFKSVFDFIFVSLFNDLFKTFSVFFVDIMSLSRKVLEMTFVQNGVSYAQALAFALLSAKVLSEGINQYILYQSGDPDAACIATTKNIIRIIIPIIATGKPPVDTTKVERKLKQAGSMAVMKMVMSKGG